MGITPDTTLRPEKPSLKRVGLAVLATVRMRRGAEAWAKSRKIHDRLAGKVKEMKRIEGRSSSAGPSRSRREERSYLATPRRTTSTSQPRSARRDDGKDGGRNISMSGGLGRKSLQDTLASVANAKRVAELRGEGRRGF